jgi:hypothetical protein
MLRTSFGAFAAISAALVVASFPNRVLADERCQQLESLHAQYAGVELTAEQKVLKQKLVAWYYGHCGARHATRED